MIVNISKELLELILIVGFKVHFSFSVDHQHQSVSLNGIEV